MNILQFDNAYHHWGLLALRSLNLHEPDSLVLCNTVNLSDDQVEELERAHSQVVVTNGVADLVTSPAQMAARKPFVMLHAMERYPEQQRYVLLDADFLVRKPLGPLWALLDTYAAALCIGDGMENGKFYPQLVTCSAIVMVRSDGKKLIDSWAKWTQHDQTIGPIEPKAWYWDQVTLAEAWKEAGIPCATIPMDIYADDRLRQSAAIWAANVGDLKPRYHELFRDEYHRQLHGRQPSGDLLERAGLV